MGIFSGMKKAAGYMFDVRVDKWLGWDNIVNTSRDYKRMLKDMSTPQQAQYSETFEQAIDRLGLTQEDIDQRKIEFTRLFIFFIVLSIAIIGYGLYMAITGNMISALISFCISLYSLTQAFRFHFWLFQIKHKKLGCTIKEWFNGETVNDIMIIPSKKSLKSTQRPGKK